MVSNLTVVFGAARRFVIAKEVCCNEVSSVEIRRERCWSRFQKFSPLRDRVCRVDFVDTGSSETVSTMNCDEHVMTIFNIVIEFAEDERVADAFVQHEDIEYRRHGLRRC